MKKKQMIGLVVAAAVFICTGIVSVLTNHLTDRIMGNAVTEILEGGTEFSAPSQNYIGVVRVVGTIEEQTSQGVFGTEQSYQHNMTREYVDRLASDRNNTGILLYVDSPGGTVYESEELYDSLMAYREQTGRPVWCYMAHYAASGGYMASVAAEQIFANQNTVTGSIGVIMSGYDLSGLYEKLGIRYFSITSGENKDSTVLSEEQMKIYQSQVDECYARFVEKVAAGRQMTQDEVRELADGRTYTAQQAVDNGLVDEITSYEAVCARMLKETGAVTFYEPESSENVLASFFSRVQGLIPKSEAQILLETAGEMESGVLMYYAEQLQ